MDGKSKSSRSVRHATGQAGRFAGSVHAVDWAGPHVPLTLCIRDPAAGSASGTHAMPRHVSCPPGSRLPATRRRSLQTRGLPTSDRPPAPRPRRLATGPCLALLCACGLVGCASLPPAWTPFPDKQKLAREQAAYGTTADQRINTLATEAKAAKAGGATQQAEFTRGLARRILEEHDPRVRARIVETVATIDTPAAVAICRGALEDPEPRVRMSACTAWAKRGGAEAVQALAARYHADQDLDVRLRALRELGNVGDGAAIPVLARALEDPDPAVQYRAVASLKKVSGRDLGDDVNKWRAWAADPAAPAEPWSMAEAFRKLF